jgi:hypothetical protein
MFVALDTLSFCSLDVSVGYACDCVVAEAVGVVSGGMFVAAPALTTEEENTQPKPAGTSKPPKSAQSTSLLPSITTVPSAPASVIPMSPGGSALSMPALPSVSRPGSASMPKYVQRGECAVLPCLTCELYVAFVLLLLCMCAV